MLLGNFKKTDTNGFRGSVRTLTLNLELAFEPNAEKKGDKSPDYRVITGDMEIGAAWKKTSDGGNAYLSVTLDDPALPAAIDCAMVKSSIEHGYSLVWERRRKARSGKGSSEF